MTEPTTSPVDRYRKYLRSFGITGHPENVRTMHELDLAGVRFFAFEDDQGVRLKAAVTGAGLVRPGGHEEDDWRGLLTDPAAAAAVAERVAWLESDEARGPDIVCPARTVVVRPGRQPPAPVDPRLRKMAENPALGHEPDGTLVLRMWLLEAERELTRWVVTAPPQGRARIERQPAAARPGPRPEDIQARAIALLATGEEPDRLWALQEIADAGNTRAVPAVAALLMEPAASEMARSLAAATLGRLGVKAATAPLGRALREAEAPEIRKASAQALSRLRGPDAVAELARAAGTEPNEGVRIEIVHALNAQGRAARNALRSIAETDLSPAIRTLAGVYEEGLR